MKWPFLILLAWMPLVGLPLSGQEAVKPEPESAPDSLAIDFPGGSLAELLDQIQQVSPQPLNIIDSAGADRIPMPSLKLKAVSAGDLMEILQHMGERNEETAGTYFGVSRVTNNTWIVVGPASPPQPPTPLPPPTPAIATAPPQASPPPKGEAAFFPVARLLKDHSVEDVLTTVSTAWEMLGLQGEPSEHLRFHTDTNLLIVTGDPATLGLVKSALGALESENRSERERELMKQVEQLQRRGEQLELQHALSRDMIDQSKAMAEEKAQGIRLSMELDMKRLAEENAELRARIRSLEESALKSRRSP